VRVSHGVLLPELSETALTVTVTARRRETYQKTGLWLHQRTLSSAACGGAKVKDNVAIRGNEREPT
jgi:hypothetical protein